MADPLTLNGALSNTQLVVARRLPTYYDAGRALSRTNPSGHYVEPQTVQAYGGGFTNYSQYWPAVPVRYNRPGESGYLQWAWINTADNLPLYTPTVPQLDAFTVSNAAVTLALRLTMEQSGNVHDVTITYGGTTIATRTGLGNITSLALTQAEAQALLQAMASVASGSVTASVVTRRGTDTIGTRSTTATATVHASIVPVIGGLTASEANAAVTAAGIGGFVQGLSRVQLSMTGVAAGYGSTIASYRLEFDGALWTASTGTSGTIQYSGTRQAKATVTDRRGRTATRTLDVVALAYTPPRIMSMQARRASSTSGTLDEAGTYLRLDRSISVSPLTVGGTQRNTMQLRIYYRAMGASAWTQMHDQSWTTAASSSGMTVPPTTLSNQQGWEIRLLLNDRFATQEGITTLASLAVAGAWVANAGLTLGKLPEPGASFVLDIKSANGVAVDGQRVLTGGDLIKFFGGTV